MVKKKTVKVSRNVAFVIKQRDFDRIQAVADEHYLYVGTWIRKTILQKLAEIETAQSKAMQQLEASGQS